MGDTTKNSIEDMEANIHGMSGGYFNPYQNSEKTCEIYGPPDDLKSGPFPDQY